GRGRPSCDPVCGQRHRRRFEPRRRVGRTRTEVPPRARRTRTPMTDERTGEPRNGDESDVRGPPWPNRNTLWGAVIADELAKSGISTVCIAPGSRSTPLTVALADHPEIHVF